MGIKRSLGFSPIGSVESEKTEFSYVGDQSPRSGRSDSIFDDYNSNSNSNLSLANSFAEKMKTQSAAIESDEEKPEKKVASYYLEVETLNKLKDWADATKASYSSVVEKALTAHLANIG